MPTKKGNTNVQPKEGAEPTRHVRTVRIRDVGGVAAFDFPIDYGVTVLLGENGAGKSSTMQATARLFGAEIPLEPRDGTEEGVVECDGVRLAIRKVVKTSGAFDVNVGLAEVGALADLIDGGGLKDEKARAERRNRAFLRLCPLPVTEQAIADLAADPELARVALAEIRDNLVGDMLGAAEKVRTCGHAMARVAEQASADLSGQAGAHDLHAEEALRKVGGLERLVEIQLADAETQERDLTSQYEVARIGARQRAELEDQQARVRAELGPKPDPDRVDDDIVTRRDAAAAHERRVAELQEELRALERQLGQEREQLKAVRQDLQHFEETKACEQERLRRWERQAAILEQAVTGPTQADVDRLEEALDAARDRTSRARHSADWARNREEAAAAAQRAKDAAQRAEVLRAIATSVQDRLGQLLADSGASGLTVIDGRLHVVEGNELWDFEKRRSDGQRIRAALQVAAKAYRGRVVPLDGRFWTALDAGARLEFAAIAADMRLLVVTEEASSGPLHYKHLGKAAA